MQKGFAHLFVIIAISLIGGLIVGGFYLFVPPEQTTEQTAGPNKQPEFSDQGLGFSFSYPKEYKVIKDTEEAFFERSKGNFRKNFANYIGYEPSKFLGALSLLDDKNSFEQSPFTIWVFENPESLSIDKWFEKYWYYPFVWGDFTERKKAVAPVKEVMVGGLTGKFGVVDYRPEKPKFVYLNIEGKIYLIKTPFDYKVGEEILKSFKFLE